MFKYTTLLLFLCLLFAGQPRIQAAAVVNHTDGNEATFVLLPAPTNFHVTGYSATSISLAWDAVPGAIGYIVEAFIGNNPVPFTAHYETGTATTFNNLTPNTLYRFEASAVDAENEIGEPAILFQKSGIIIDLVADYHNHPTLELITPNIVDGQHLTYYLPYQQGASYWFYVGKDGAYAEYELRWPTPPNIDVAELLGGFTSPFGFKVDDWLEPNQSNVEKIRVCYSSSEEDAIGDITIAAPSPMTLIFEWYGAPPSHSFTMHKRSTSQRFSALETTESIQVSPNPFNTQLQITGLNPNAETTLQLFHFDGRLAQAQQSTTAQNYNLNTQHLPPGVYFLRIESEGVQKTHKLVKI